MGRSVSYPRGAHVAFAHFESLDAADLDGFAWDDYVDDITERAKELWPSLHEPYHVRWLHREDRVLLSNDHAHFGVSEYCGLVAIWIVMRDDVRNENLSQHWVDVAGAKLVREFGELRKVGTASNGESFFERVGGAG